MTDKQEIPFGYCHCGCGQKTKIAKENHAKYGWVSGQPYKFVRNHRGKGLDAEPIEERFWRKVDKRGPDECWEWKEARTIRGYGKFWMNGKSIAASRAAYVFTHGKLPSDKFVCHTCDNPPCCNPNHLFCGTNADNAHDMVTKHRQSFGQSHAQAIFPNRPRGSNHHRARFSEDAISAMRELYTTGHWSQYRLARAFSTVQPVISAIVTGKSRKHG